MSAEMDWSPNYCLNCDRETTERHYCSQSCRLADYEKSAVSAPVSPSYDLQSTISFSMATANKTNIKFQLPPPFDFSAYRHGALRLESPPLSPRGASQTQTQAQTAYHHSYSSSMHQTSSQGHAPLHRTTSDYSQVRQRSLNTSTSRSSLSSIASSHSTTSGLSDQALSQLQNYSNSFDHSRDWKRRITLG